MKAIVIYEPGGPDKLLYTLVPTPTVKPGWSLVKIAAFGINHSEIFTRKGQSPSVKFPRILGIECVGTVAQTSDPERLPEGRKVLSIMGEMGRAFDGGYAEYALLPNEQIYPVDSALPWEQLAAIPETGYTAYGSMRNLRITGDERVLVRGAASGVGVAFAKMVRARWPEIFIAGSSRRPEKAERLLAEGFDEVILEKDGKLQTGQCFDKVLELVGPSSLRDTFAHTSEGGIVCNTGLLGGEWVLNDFDPIEELPHNGYLTSFYSGVVDEKLQEMFDFLEEYRVDLQPEKIFTLEEVPAAHAWLESSESFGKAVVVNEVQ